MSIFSRRDKNRPSYLDASLEEYKPRYTSLLDALEHEIAAGSQDVKALRVMLPDDVYEIFHHGGEIKHVYKWNNYFNLGKRLPLRWDEKQLSPWIDSVQGESRNEALLYTSVQRVNEGDARSIFAALAIRWAAELSIAIEENLKDSTAPRAEYSIHLLEDQEQAREIAAWDFLQVNSYELCHFADAYNRICQEKMDALHITSPRDTFALNMEDEDERRGFWENSDECTKVIVDRTPGNYEVEDLYSEELGLRRDMMLTSLEALAFDDNVLINGVPVEFTMEEGLPGIEEFATFNQREEAEREQQLQGMGSKSVQSGDEPNGKKHNDAEVTSHGDTPTEIESANAPHAFMDQGDPLGESVALRDISHTPTEWGGMKFTPVLQDAMRSEVFPGVQLQSLESETLTLDNLSSQLGVIENQLASLTEMYSQSSEEYNALSLERAMADNPSDEITPSPGESEAEAEAKDFANGGFFVLENLERQRAEINEARMEHLHELESILSRGDMNTHVTLLGQMCSAAMNGINNVKNVALPHHTPEAVLEEEQELQTLEKMEIKH